MRGNRYIVHTTRRLRGLEHMVEALTDDRGTLHCSGVTKVGIAKSTPMEDKLGKTGVVSQGAATMAIRGLVWDGNCEFFDSVGIVWDGPGSVYGYVDGSDVAVVTPQRLLRSTSEGRNPVGQHFAGVGRPQRSYEMVGVVEDTPTRA